MNGAARSNRPDDLHRSRRQAIERRSAGGIGKNNDLVVRDIIAIKNGGGCSELDINVGVFVKGNNLAVRAGVAQRDRREKGTKSRKMLLARDGQRVSRA